MTSNVDELVQKCWKVESCGTLPKKDPTLLPKNDKDDKPILPYNRTMAISRMLSLERKFEKQPSLKSKYVETINEYIEKRHASKLPHKVTKKEQSEIINYIRVVFDAGARYENISLDEKLYKGPGLLNSLVGTLLRFRQGKYSVMANIEKMLKQVMLQQKDRDALTFLWRSNKDEEFQDLRMNVES